MHSPVLRSALLLALLVLGALPLHAQPLPEEVPPDWAHLDAERDGFAGMSTYRAYEELLAGRTPRRSVIVAVIDSGVDTAHVGLAGRLWRNPGEIAGTGRDDDGNGYVDDVYGWNFIGGSDGQNVAHDTYEVAREVARLQPRFDGLAEADLAPGDSADYAHYRDMLAQVDSRRAEMTEYMMMLASAQMAQHFADAALAVHFGSQDYTLAEVEKLDPSDDELAQARDIALYLAANGVTPDALTEQLDYVQGLLTYGLNPDFDPRPIVGDDPDDLTERFYGNADVHGPDPSHGTGVAGAIAGLHGTDFHAYGVAADSVFIMAVRAVPDGDERDKDVANAIRYAVDNGAQIVNMSFGKPVSPNRGVVDEAVRYAMERGVLLVHAAGNDGRDLDVDPSFPTRFDAEGAEAPLWIEVGASSALPDVLVASFSNYSARRVDVFAPGEDVQLLKPGNEASRSSGTSFAAPHVAGLAALLMTHYPELSAEEVRRIILETATPLGELEVVLPGGGGEEGEGGVALVPFSRLSATGGVINVYEAVRRAGAASGTH
jgi:subtilisin family serine protease